MVEPVAHAIDFQAPDRGQPEPLACLLVMQVALSCVVVHRQGRWTNSGGVRTEDERGSGEQGRGRTQDSNECAGYSRGCRLRAAAQFQTCTWTEDSIGYVLAFSRALYIQLIPCRIGQISQTKVDLCQSLGDSHRTKSCFQQVCTCISALYINLHLPIELKTERRDLTTQRMRGA